MNEYVCKLGEFSGSDYLEFRKGNSGAGRKFLRQDSLYVLDSAFFFFLERIFREIITSFDMFEDTCVTRREWQEIMHLNIPEIVPSEFCAATRFNQNRRHNTIREISFGEYKRFPGAELRETVIVKTPVH